MTKLLFIYGPLGGGGAERVLLDLLSNLDYSKFEVDLCLIVNQGILLSEVPKQVTILPLWQTYSLSYKIGYRMSVWFGINFWFKRVINQKITKKYDVEISFLEGMPLKFHALLHSTAKKITWVHCDLLRFPYQSEQFFKSEELAAYNKMNTIVFVSNQALLAFEQRFPKCFTKKTVLYSPIDEAKIVRLANEKPLEKAAIFTIVSVGRLTLPKRMDRVIRLAARLKAENRAVAFQIIGDGELKNELLNLQKNCGVLDTVSFLGFLKNPYPFIKNADVLLLTSDYEGFGLVLCEAMCLGVPVVATKTAGTNEILNENQFGVLCDLDEESIYEAISKMMMDEEARNRYKKLGLQRVAEFGTARAVAQFTDLLQL